MIGEMLYRCSPAPRARPVGPVPTTTKFCCCSSMVMSQRRSLPRVGFSAIPSHVSKSGCRKGPRGIRPATWPTRGPILVRLWLYDSMCRALPSSSRRHVHQSPACLAMPVFAAEALLRSRERDLEATRILAPDRHPQCCKCRAVRALPLSGLRAASSM